MSYISAVRTKDQVFVWERNKDGRETKKYSAPYYFYVKDSNGEYTSLYGDKLIRYDFDTSEEFYNAKTRFKEMGVKLFESDIPPELKVLSEHYYGTPAADVNVTFFDIEVDYSEEIGFSSTDNPYAPINSIALYHKWSKRMVLIAIPPTEYKGSLDHDYVIDELQKIAPIVDNVKVDFIFVKNERELLTHFLNEIQDSDIISGWNSDFFDVPYIGKRLEKYNKQAFRMLSFDDAPTPKFREVETNFRKNLVLDIHGRVSLDYMVLFRKYEMDGRPSYKLEAIADEVLEDLPKLEYEGSLANLYRKNFLHFIRYNIRDTEILKGFEEVLGYVGVANTSKQLSTALFSHVTGTIKLSELSVINYCHHEKGGLIVNDISPPEIDRSIQGALVLYPQTGKQEYVGSIDIKSLYPSSIMALNISPEMMRGQFVNDVMDHEELMKQSNKVLTLSLEDGGTEEYTAKEWIEILKDRKWAVSGFGTIFDQSETGIIPSILSSWFTMRKDFQKKKQNATNETKKFKDVENLTTEQKAELDEWSNLETYYDKLQYVYKIKLNSFYGALSNRFFRLYSINLGESTTATGRAILKHQCRKVAEQLEGNYNVDFPLYHSMNKKEIDDNVDPNVTLMGPVFNGHFQSEAVIYGDTDSCYFNTFATNKEDAILVADAVAEVVNKSYQGFMQRAFLCQPGFDTKISCSREIVTGRGIFVNKKRYMLHVLNQDGYDVDKMKVMGLETKKTILPKWVSTELNKFIERFLKGEDWATVEQDIVKFKDVILNTPDIMAIGIPKGVNGVEEYSSKYMIDKKTFLPGGVAASVLYNACLKQYGDKISPPIVSGTKIKVFHITKSIDRFKTIAIPTDIEVVPEWFLSNFSVAREEHVTRLIDNPLKNIITCLGYRVPSKQTLTFDSIFGD